MKFQHSAASLMLCLLSVCFGVFISFIEFVSYNLNLYLYVVNAALPSYKF